jgi:hypothetical protein
MDMDTGKKDIFADTSEASEVQLNAVEFRNYRSSLLPEHQTIVESILNHWCALLVRGKAMRVNNQIEKCYLDKDLLTFYVGNDSYLLKHMKSINFAKDQYNVAEYLLECAFEDTFEEYDLCFAFEQKKQRLHFAIALRILRCRDPTLDPDFDCEVTFDDTELPKPLKFQDLNKAYRLQPEKGFPVVFSVADVKVISKMRTTAKLFYLEFFVDYPSQDPFLYAKSPAIQIPGNLISVEDPLKRMPKDDAEAEARRRARLLVDDLDRRPPIGQLNFEMKNVKLRVPKVPHKVFGRLMAKDEFFPTAMGTFEVDIEASEFVDRSRTKKNKGEVEEKEPEPFAVQIMSASKVSVWARDGRTNDEKESCIHIEICTMTLRVVGYL